MKKLSDLMPAALEQKEVLRAARAQTVMRRWAEVVGMVLAEKAVPERFDSGTLWVAATGSAWAQEICLRKELILERLNDLAGEPLFRDLRVGAREPRRDLSKPEADET
jgi:predicted nucleic acid-binding Zn ribbon protein